MSFARNVKIVHVVNRTTKPLEATWDGYTYQIPAGFKRIETQPPSELRAKLNKNGKPIIDEETKEAVMETYQPPVEVRIVGADRHGDVLRYPMPYFAAEAAMRQNPKMGTLNHLNPNDFEPLVCVPEWGHPVEHTEQSDDAIELLDRSHMDADRQNVQHNYVPGTRRSPQKTNRYAMYGGRTSLGHTNPFGMDMRGDATGGSAGIGE